MTPISTSRRPAAMAMARTTRSAPRSRRWDMRSCGIGSAGRAILCRSVMAGHDELWQNAVRRLRDLLALKHQRQIIGGHLGGFDQHQAGARCQLFQILDIAHAPFGVSFAQAGVEY